MKNDSSDKFVLEYLYLEDFAEIAYKYKKEEEDVKKDEDERGIIIIDIL